MTTPPPANEPVQLPGEQREIRNAVVLCAEFAEYAAWTSDQDPEELHDRLTGLVDQADRLVKAHGGRVERRTGSALLATFGVALARGREAEQAVLTAMAIQAGAADSGGARVGIASGQLLVEPAARQDTLIGGPLDAAGALARQAAARETLVTDEIRRALAERLVTERLEAGIGSSSGRGSVHRVLRVASLDEARAQHPFVGRASECALLGSVIQACSANRRGHVVLLRGEAGIGKSRLADEVLAHARGAGFECHAGYALDFGVRAGTDAIGTLVRSLLGGSDGASEQQRCALAERAIEAGVLDASHRGSLYEVLDLPLPDDLRASLEALDPSCRTAASHDCVASLVAARSRRAAQVLLVEDVHWATAETIAALATVAAATRAAPVLLVMTTRVERDPIESAWRVTAGAPVTTIDLGPLSEEEARTLAAQYEIADIRWMEACVRRAEGHPLFLDQLLRSGDRERQALPDSVHSVVLARLDRLTPGDRTALQAAAILGQRLSVAALAHLLDAAAVDCSRLVAQGLLRPQGGDYLFAHALIQEAVRASLPRSRRRELHRKVAEWYSERDAALHAEHLDAAGDPGAAAAFLRAAEGEAERYHYERALRVAERGLATAGDGALRSRLSSLRGRLLSYLGEMDQSLMALREALAMTEDPRGRCRIWMDIAADLRVMDRHAEALEALAHAEAEGEERMDARLLSQINCLRGDVYFPLGDIGACLAAHERARQLAIEAASPVEEARALSGLGDANYQRGRVTDARRLYDVCVQLARRHGLARVECANLAMLGWTRFYHNELRAGVEEVRRGAEAARAIGELRAEMLAHLLIAAILPYLADWQGAREAAERGLTLAKRIGARRFIGDGLQSVAIAEYRLGAPAEAVQASLEDAWQIHRESSPVYSGPWVLAQIARVTTDERRRVVALAEGEALLAQGCVSHCYFHFYQIAIDVALGRCDWDAAERYAQALEHYTRADPLPWCEFYMARGRALAHHGRGRRDAANQAELQRLTDVAEKAGLREALPALAGALTAVNSS